MNATLHFPWSKEHHRLSLLAATFAYTLNPVELILSHLCNNSPCSSLYLVTLYAVLGRASVIPDLNSVDLAVVPQRPTIVFDMSPSLVAVMETH